MVSRGREIGREREKEREGEGLLHKGKEGAGRSIV